MPKESWCRRTRIGYTPLDNLGMLRDISRQIQYTKPTSPTSPKPFFLNPIPTAATTAIHNLHLQTATAHVIHLASEAFPRLETLVMDHISPSRDSPLPFTQATHPSSLILHFDKHSAEVDSARRTRRTTSCALPLATSASDRIPDECTA
jgi:hypothetical protein